MSGLYEVLKGNVYSEAVVASGKTNQDAQAAGFKDVYDYVMSDSDHPRQAFFLQSIMKMLSEKQRQILFDGMAKEYAGVDGWMAYVDRENS